MTDYLISKGPIGEEDQNKWDGVNTTFTRDTSTGGSITLNSVGTAVDALIVYGGGVNYTAATINLAISSIGSSKVRLLLRQGSWVLEDDVTVPSNITLEIADGALITTTGYTLTISGGLVAPPQKVFSGTGTVTVAKGTVVNPLWWGAIGDGSTDCTAALQYAVNAVSDDGGIVLIPASDTYYKVTDAITVSHPVTIVGESRYYSQIHQATAAKTIFTVTASYVTIKDLHLTGPGGISLSSGSTAISVTGYSAASMSQSVRVEGCIIASWGDKGIYLIYTQNFAVKDCKISTVYTAGVETRSVNTGEISGNVISTCTSYGILAVRNATDSLITDPRSSYVHICNNRVSDVSAGEGIHVGAGSYVTVDGNFIYNSNLGIVVTYAAGATAGISYAPYYCNIVNNVCDSSVVDGSRDVGITLGGALATGGGSVIEYGRNCNIIGNVIIGYGDETSLTGCSLLCYATACTIISGNSIKDGGSNGIFLQPFNYEMTLVGNTMTNIFSSTVAVGKAIGLHVSGDYNTFIASDLNIAKRDDRGTYELDDASGIGVFVANNANTSGKLGLVHGNSYTLLSDTGSKVSKNLNA